MNRQPAQDARPLVAVVAGLVIATLLGAAHSPWWLPEWTGALLVRPLVLIPVTLSLVVMAACRVVATRRSLASRTRLVVLAPDSFDPSVDAVLRCAAQLSRVRRAVGGWLDPRARAVRVLLDCDEQGRMRYSLSVPERALPAIRSALGVYDRVQAHVPEPKAEVHASEEIEEEAHVPDSESKEPETNREGPETQLSVVRAELRLARSSSEPLAHLPLSPDPLQGFAQVLAGLDREHGEQAEIAVDLLPTTPGTRRRLRRRLLRQARRRDHDAFGGDGGLLDVLGGGRPTGRARPAEMVEQRAAAGGDRREAVAARSSVRGADSHPVLEPGEGPGGQSPAGSARVLRRVCGRQLSASRRRSLPGVGVRGIGPPRAPGAGLTSG